MAISKKKNLSFSPLFMIKCNNVESALFSPLSYYYHGQNVDIIKEMAYSCLSGALRKHIVSLEFSDHFPDFLLHFCKIFFLLRVRSHQLHSRQQIPFEVKFQSSAYDEVILFATKKKSIIWKVRIPFCQVIIGKSRGESQELRFGQGLGRFGNF